MRALLDVNVLVAYGLQSHTHHAAVTAWITERHSKLQPFTSPIVELCFVRICMVLASISLNDAKVLLADQLRKLNASMVPDTLGADALPDWVQGHKQTTDAYLLTLAKAHDLEFITLDKKLPGAVAL